MDVLAMKRQGMSYVEIGEKLGYHPDTISKWVKAGGPPAARMVADEDRVVDPVWADRLTELLVGNPKLLATSLFEIVAAEGFEGSYPSVVRWVREQRGPRFRAADGASVPIETAPGEEAQFDFSDCSAWAQSVGLGPVLWCFGMILCWSRWRTWWFTTSVDRQHTFEGVAGFFDAAGGVPQVARTDRMGALGQSQGRRKQAEAGARQGLAAKSKKRRSAEEIELEKLRAKNARLEAELAKTKTALEITGKVHALLEQLSESADTDPPSKP
ncbi:MAG: hypothetical protein ACE367_18370 [Acidimicrobiales bacterium]